MRRSILLSGLAMLFAAKSVHAGLSVPTARTSELTACMVFCPQGDITFLAIVRDQTDLPIANSVVTLDFSHCPSFQHCAPNAPYLYDDGNKTVKLSTDAQGKALFSLKMGGVCPGTQVSIFADGVLLGMRSLTSPDQDGSLEVHGDDIAAVVARIGPTDPLGDVNCAGAVDANDVAFANAHLGHACSGVVPVHPSTWGVLKQHYR